MEIEKEPEITALLQPNSASIGLKKTPKAKKVPQTAYMIHRAAATTTYP
jgi:hypothetical protein